MSLQESTSQNKTAPRPESALDAALRSLRAAAATKPAGADEAGTVLASINRYVAETRHALASRSGSDLDDVIEHLSEIELTADIVDSNDSMTTVEAALDEIESHVAEAWALL